MFQQLLQQKSRLRANSEQQIVRSGKLSHQKLRDRLRDRPRVSLRAASHATSALTPPRQADVLFACPIAKTFLTAATPIEDSGVFLRVNAPRRKASTLTPWRAA